MDVVYILAKGHNDNIEFRYSLRSLKYIKHDKVFVVGYKPTRLKNVIHIPFDDCWYKYDNVAKKQKMIMNNNDISEEFVYMNDDFYFLMPQEVEYYKIGSLKTQMEYIYERDECTRLRWLPVPQYYTNLKYVLDIFKKWDSFESHTPIRFNRSKMKAMFKEYPDLPPTSIRTAYCLYYKIKWQWLPNMENYKGYKRKLSDCKCYNINKFKVNEWQPLLSTENSMCKEQKFRDYMERKFPNRSIYEKEFLSNKSNTMLFTAKPKYAVSLSKLVQFDSQGNYATDDKKLIDELMKVSSVKLVEDKTIQWWVVKKEPRVEIDKKEIFVPIEDKPLDIKVVREQYKEKMGKKAFGGWSIEQLQEKMK